MTFLSRIQAEHLLVATLLILAALSVSAGNTLQNALHIIAAVLAAAVLDFFLGWLVDKRKAFPWLGLVSGLIIAVVLAPSPPFALAAAVLAMLSKYFLRLKRRNIFNPAAFAMFVLSAFGATVGWWAVLHPAIIPLGLLVAWRIRRLETSLSFLVVYFVITYFIKGTIPLDDYTAYFFAFVMVLEPVTSPFTRKGKLLFGPAVALLAALLPLFLNAPLNLFLGSLLLMNLFTPWLNKMKSQPKAAAAAQTATKPAA